MSPARRTAALAVSALLVLPACGQGGAATGSDDDLAAPSAAATTSGGSAMTTSTPGPDSAPAPPTSSAPPVEEPTPSAPATGGASPRPSGGSLPLLPRPTSPPTAPTDVPQPVVLVGEVVEPSAPGCVEMTTGGQVVALRLPEGVSVAVGDRVRVTGTPRPVERGTPCAGTPVVVTDVAPA
ncbi:hypothetical protein [uncultured Pseudokineococcus sp.]|uniref:hypothetical protein n=1 Tax=uncultured Pseudokineococcus sp. TaxID=1642928 RepID=UPI00260D295D|nr:hypothetical protein [uncultured Pseudokineococcus sp.]